MFRCRQPQGVCAEPADRVPWLCPQQPARDAETI